MNEHTKRLISRILISCDRYINNELTAEDLQRNVTAIMGGIEEKIYIKPFEKLDIVIEKSIYLYSETEGRNRIIKEIETIKKCLSS